MSEARRIPVERGTDLPTVTIMVNGTPISAEYHVIGITIRKSV